jgi:hypothetical protein
MRGRRQIMGVDFPQFVHEGSNPPETVCYLFHLDPALEHAKHYLGLAEDLEVRDSMHRSGRGANLLAVQKERGGDWHLVRTWAGGRLRERALKMQSGARYCPECTDFPQSGNQELNPARWLYLTRKERAALKSEKEEQEKAYEAARAANRDKGPGVQIVNAREVTFEEPKPYKRTPEKEERLLMAITELEALWIRQAKEREMQELLAGHRREGAEAGEREATEAIARGMSPDEAMARHEEIAGLLDHEAETDADRAFAVAYYQAGRYAGESLREELANPQAYAEREGRQPVDVEKGA